LSFLGVVVVVDNLGKTGSVDDSLEAKTLYPVRISIHVKVNTGRLVSFDAENTSRLEAGSVSPPSISIKTCEPRAAVLAATLGGTACLDLEKLVPSHVLFE
jgi:hypothetical protein